MPSPSFTSPRPLRLRRLALGLRQADLADLSGISLSTIHRLEDGETTRPGWRTVARLATVLGCHPEDIFPSDEGE